ncbi:sugar phosphate isomerase/epimerase family protein [Pseudoclavibacter terrae]|uniref:sugar phosphate isomerase/epimerase family protein n=1 Tax=Pseudoclavibacter terrae TaxID=1530195 RepID=UPI00232EACCD|nr:sugar phosphate isomerase/epimerase family protein [Pseudoclavibacter terrae]
MSPKIAMNVTTTFHGNLRTDIAAAREAGFTGIELQSPKLYRYLDAGFPAETVRELVGELTVTGLGAVQNIERHGDDKPSFIADVERMCDVAVAVGAPTVQLCTGPAEWTTVRDHRDGLLPASDGRYRGTLGLSEADAMRVLTDNVRDAATIAADRGIGVFVEPLAWTNINRCAQLLRLIDAVDRDNVGIAVDFWHFWTTGDTLEEVAALPAERITAVHISDSTEINRATEIANVDDHRDVVIGGGSVPLQEWVDAVKSTGYKGWWVTEMFAKRANEHDFLDVARTMRGLTSILVS